MIHQNILHRQCVLASTTIWYIAQTTARNWNQTRNTALYSIGLSLYFSTHCIATVICVPKSFMGMFIVYGWVWEGRLGRGVGGALTPLCLRTFLSILWNKAQGLWFKVMKVVKKLLFLFYFRFQDSPLIIFTSQSIGEVLHVNPTNHFSLLIFDVIHEKLLPLSDMTQNCRIRRTKNGTVKKFPIIINEWIDDSSVEKNSKNWNVLLRIKSIVEYNTNRIRN